MQQAMLMQLPGGCRQAQAARSQRAPGAEQRAAGAAAGGNGSGSSSSSGDEAAAAAVPPAGAWAAACAHEPQPQPQAARQARVASLSQLASRPRTPALPSVSGAGLSGFADGAFRHEAFDEVDTLLSSLPGQGLFSAWDDGGGLGDDCCGNEPGEAQPAASKARVEDAGSGADAAAGSGAAADTNGSATADDGMVCCGSGRPAGGCSSPVAVADAAGAVRQLHRRASEDSARRAARSLSGNTSDDGSTSSSSCGSEGACGGSAAAAAGAAACAPLLEAAAGADVLDAVAGALGQHVEEDDMTADAAAGLASALD
jgi:hypothetical protein